MLEYISYSKSFLYKLTGAESEDAKQTTMDDSINNPGYNDNDANSQVFSLI